MRGNTQQVGPAKGGRHRLAAVSACGAVQIGPYTAVGFIYDRSEIFRYYFIELTEKTLKRSTAAGSNAAETDKIHAG
jgi:hypothetical protein